jgi:hypothetical protein
MLTGKDYKAHINIIDSQNAEFLSAFATLRKATISFVMSVCPSVNPHGTTRLPLDGFVCNLICNSFSKTCRKNSSSITI